jgi:catechol 2,3-dioxygenase-like lactoylglutathione lyase family enzyme
LRPFVGAEDFGISRRFYRDFGFEEIMLGPGFSAFKSGNFAFYLQDAYVKDWIDNTMIFLEVGDVESHYRRLLALGLDAKYRRVRISGIREENWGKEFFVHDPSGILWHIGEFYDRR